MQRYSKKNPQFIFLIITIIFMLFFLMNRGSSFRDGSLGDEVFNASIVYQICLGRMPFVNGWDIFQSGDLFQIPFVKLFLFLNGGSTDGIILFLRILCLSANTVSAFYLYIITRKTISKTAGVAIAIFMMANVPIGFYFVNYDYAQILFSTLSLFTLVYTLNQEKVAKGFSFLSGIWIACMVFSYPSMIVYSVFLAVVYSFLALKKHKGIQIGYVCLGAASIFFLFLIYCFSQGLDHLMFFNQNVLSAVLYGRNFSSTSGEVTSILSQAFYTLYTFLTMFGKYLIAIAITYILWFLLRKKIRKKHKIIFLLVTLLVPFVVHDNVYGFYYWHVIYYAYLFFLLPLVYFELENSLKKKWKIQMILVWGGLVIPFFIYAYTTATGSGRMGMTGFYPAAILFIILCSQWIENGSANVSQEYIIYVPGLYNVFSCCVMLFSIYTSGANLSPIMTKGIYKGIANIDLSLQQLERQQSIQDLIDDDIKTIAFSPTSLTSTQEYLYANLLGVTPVIDFNFSTPEDVNQQSLAYYYYQHISEYPDLIVLPASIDMKNVYTDLKKILNSKYILILNNEFYHVYKEIR